MKVFSVQITADLKTKVVMKREEEERRKKDEG
jgi:hypothetical protein